MVVDQSLSIFDTDDENQGENEIDIADTENKRSKYKKPPRPCLF